MPFTKIIDQIQVISHQMEISSSLRNYVKDELGAMIEKYKIMSSESIVLFSKPLHAMHTEISLRLGKENYLRASAEGETAYFSFDNAFHKVKRNLQRYKKRMTDYHKCHDVKEEYRGLAALTTKILGEHQEEGAHPPIIAETVEMLPVFSVADAVATMELSGREAFVFRNSGSKHINVLYRRTDGNIGWIDPQLEKEKLV